MILDANYGIRFLPLVLALFNLGGCGMTSFGGRSGKISVGSSWTGENDNYQINSMNPQRIDENLEAMDLSELRMVSFDSYYTHALSSIRNDLTIVGGLEFLNVLDFVIQKEELYSELFDKYPTIGSYLDSIGIASEFDIVDEKVDIGLNLMSKFFRERNLSDFVGVDSLNKEKVQSDKALDGLKSNGMDNFVGDEMIFNSEHFLIAALGIHGGRSSSSLLLEGGGSDQQPNQVTEAALQETEKNWTDTVKKGFDKFCKKTNGMPPCPWDADTSGTAG